MAQILPDNKSASDVTLAQRIMQNDQLVTGIVDKIDVTMKGNLQRGNDTLITSSEISNIKTGAMQQAGIGMQQVSQDAELYNMARVMLYNTFINERSKTPEQATELVNRFMPVQSRLSSEDIKIAEGVHRDPSRTAAAMDLAAQGITPKIDIFTTWHADVGQGTTSHAAKIDSQRGDGGRDGR